MNGRAGEENDQGSQTMNTSQGNTTRVVIVEDVELEAKLITRALADRGFSDVQHFLDVSSAIAAIESSHSCIVITDVELPKATGFDLIRRVRARKTKGSYVYFVVLTGKGNPTRLREAFDAGADDYMLKPFQREELVARVKVGERIVRLERMASLRAIELESALRRIDETEARAALERAEARAHAPPATGAEALVEAVPWEDLRGALRESLIAFVGSARDATTSDPRSAIVGRVTLADASRELEVGISVVVEGSAMTELCNKVLGEPGDFESGSALVLETANLLMGALKTLYFQHGYDFTSGIPSSPTLDDARASHDARAIRQRFAFNCDGVALDIWLFVSEKRNARVRGLNLREGMILAEDAHDPHGMLLVRAGVRLSETSAMRLNAIVGARELLVASQS